MARPKAICSISKAKQVKSTVAHSLQLAAEVFKRIRESQISKLKGGYSTDAMLLFNSWLKDIEMCIEEWRLLNLETV